jgi:hypothetical protein
LWLNSGLKWPRTAILSAIPTLRVESSIAAISWIDCPAEITDKR